MSSLHPNTTRTAAAARARATRAANPLIQDPLAEPLVRAVVIDSFTRLATGELDPADVDAPGLTWGPSADDGSEAARTRYFDASFGDATAGIRQAVILASGLDTRAYRLSWPPETTLFEIDQPRVLEFKTATLADLGVASRTDVRAVAIDLRHDWPAALREAGFDSSRPTAWIAEGLLTFRPPDAQDRLLDNITRLSANGRRLATVTCVREPMSTLLKPNR